MGNVVVVGSINQDHVLTVARRPRPGETVTGGTLDVRGGGKGANQAVAAADAGAEVTLVARVGSDIAGTGQREDLARRGVDVSWVTTTDGVATGAAFITVTPDGENAVSVVPGANGMLAVSDVDAVAARLFSDSVVVAQLEIPLDTLVAAVRRCGPTTHVLVNAAPFVALPRALLERVDTLVVNEHEAESLLGSPVAGAADAVDGAARLRSRGPGAVIVTLGADGAVVVDGHGATHVPAPLVPVVDSTGAGDIFVGTLAALLADGHALDGAVSVAVGRASDSVSTAGARSPA
jgi:ribokinase